jgi:hypothetical protein
MKKIYPLFKKMTTSKLLGLMTFLVSMGTFTVLLYEIHLTRRQQYVSVLPYLEIGYSAPSFDEYSLILVNNGIGPAFIEEFEVLVNDKIIHSDMHLFFTDYISKIETIPFDGNIASSNIAKGRMLPSGKTIRMLGASGSEESAKRLKNLFLSDSINIKIIFSSVYGEKWLLDKQKGIAKITK